MNTTATRKHTGYRRNVHRTPLRNFGAHPIASADALSVAVSLAPFAPPIFDQGRTGSCVGHSRARGIYMARAAAGRPLGFIPSMALLYKMARCFERADWGAPLEDNGCDPNDTLEVVRRWGFHPMGPQPDPARLSDADPATINELPFLDDLEASEEFELLGDYQITDTGADRVTLVQKALVAGCPVGIDVSGGGEQWQTYGGGVLVPDGTPLDHYVLLVGYVTDATGRVTFQGHNSWGASWGNAGAFEASPDVVGAAGDLIVCVEDSP